MRDTKTRKADVLAALNQHDDMWLSTADPDGRPHLIPVSGWWDGTHLVIATTGASRTAQNMNTNRPVRLAGGSPSDAIMVDTDSVERSAVEDPAQLARGVSGAVGAGPLHPGCCWVFLRPRTQPGHG